MSLQILKGYSSYPAVEDEIDRAKYLLSNIHENKAYFIRRVLRVSSFLPRNQLLYSLIYLGVIPASMSVEMYIRPPTIAYDRIVELQKLLRLDEYFPGIVIAKCTYLEFIKQFCVSSQAVFFTGRAENAKKVRHYLSPDILFVHSGAGHNPIIVFKTANIINAVNSIIRCCFYNQGQDCSAPNSVFVQQAVLNQIMKSLIEQVHKTTIATELGYDPANPIGPNTDIQHFDIIMRHFQRLAEWRIEGGSINPTNGIILPTLFCKPLELGAELDEFFAPVIMVQPFSTIKELNNYLFSNANYQRNAMYLTIFGETSNETLIELWLKQLSNLHKPDTIIRESDLLYEERGTRPYGGYGADASCVHYLGMVIPTPILPQRELFRFLIEPALHQAEISLDIKSIRQSHHKMFQESERAENSWFVTDRPRLSITSSCANCRDEFNNGILTRDDQIVIGGRVQAIRLGGLFFDIHDGTALIQVCCSREAELQRFSKLIHKNDIIACLGVLNRTKHGYVTLNAKELEFWSNSLNNTPLGISMPQDLFINGFVFNLEQLLYRNGFTRYKDFAIEWNFDRLHMIALDIQLTNAIMTTEACQKGRVWSWLNPIQKMVSQISNPWGYIIIWAIYPPKCFMSDIEILIKKELRRALELDEQADISLLINNRKNELPIYTDRLIFKKHLNYKGKDISWSFRLKNGSVDDQMEKKIGKYIRINETIECPPVEGIILTMDIKSLELKSRKKTPYNKV